MANTETANRSKIVGTIDSTGQTSSITVMGSRLVDVSVDYDTNSFVGTIILQRETNTGALNVPEFQNVETYTSSTEKVVRSAAPTRYRLDCTVASSGTAEFALTAGNRE